MARRISWTNNSSGHDGTSVYRDTTIDPQNLPTPVATVDPVAQGAKAEWIDLTGAGDQCYAVRDFQGASVSALSDVHCFDAPAEIIGVALTDDTVQGGGFVHIDVDGNTIASPSTSEFNNKIIWGSVTDETIDDQDMVKIPKFYYKRGPVAGGEHDGRDAWWISSEPASGFTVHPAFILSGVEVDQIWVGKYEGWIDGESKLASQPAVTPTGGRSWTQFQADAEARNVSGVTGFRQIHIDMRSAIQWLYLVENASFDTQAVTGQGNTTSGSTQLTDSADNAAASYRGIFALWGNLNEWTDGLRHVDGAIDRRGYGGGTWDSTGENRPSTSIVYMNTVRQSSSIEDLFVANTFQSGNAGSTVPDFHGWLNSGERVPIVGGNQSNGSDAGLWYLLLASTSTTTSSVSGSRLARVV